MGINIHAMAFKSSALNPIAFNLNIYDECPKIAFPNGEISDNDLSEWHRKKKNAQRAPYNPECLGGDDYGGKVFAIFGYFGTIAAKSA